MSDVAAKRALKSLEARYIYWRLAVTMNDANSFLFAIRQFTEFLEILSPHRRILAGEVCPHIWQRIVRNLANRYVRAFLRGVNRS